MELYFVSRMQVPGLFLV